MPTIVSVSTKAEEVTKPYNRRAAQTADRLRLASDAVWGAGWLSSDPVASGGGLDADLVFTTAAGGPVDLSNLRRSFCKLLRRAGVEEVGPLTNFGTPAISMMSHEGVALELIADAAGHKELSRHRDRLPAQPRAGGRVGSAAMAARLARRSS